MRSHFRDTVQTDSEETGKKNWTQLNTTQHTHKTQLNITYTHTHTLAGLRSHAACLAWEPQHTPRWLCRLLADFSSVVTTLFRNTTNAGAIFILAWPEEFACTWGSEAPGCPTSSSWCINQRYPDITCSSNWGISPCEDNKRVNVCTRQTPQRPHLLCRPISVQVDTLALLGLLDPCNVIWKMITLSCSRFTVESLVLKEWH